MNAKLDVDIVYISQSKFLVDLKEKLCNFEKVKKLYTESMTKDNIKLWKINPNANHQEIYKAINQIQSNEKNTITVDFLTYLECNYF